MSHREQFSHMSRDIILVMNKKKTRLELAREILSNVKKEMEKPRLTESVRSGSRDQAKPVIDNAPSRSKRLRTL